MSRARVLSVVLAVVLLATGAFWTGGTGQGAHGLPATVALAPISSPPPLSVELRDHRIRSVRRGGRSARARDAAEEIRVIMERLYGLGFVDAARRGEVDASGLEELFAGGAQESVGEDLDRLTLGTATPRFTDVETRHASVAVRILAARRRGTPVLAVANMEFSASGTTEDGPLPIEHRGRYTLRRVDGEWRIVSYDVEGRIPDPGEFPRLSVIPHPAEPRAARARAVPEVPSKRRLFFLVIGSDARPGEPEARLRADSIHIVGVNPKRRAGAIVGIPRDSFVSIPGAGTSKINDALAIGGPRLMVRTVRRLTGIPIDGYLVTGFRGFTRLVGAVGGLRIKVPYRMSDAASGAFFSRGVRRVRGTGALAFARNRHDAPGGDFGRSLNQGHLMLAALREYRTAVKKDPAQLILWVVAGMRTVRTDLSLGEALGLMLAAPRIHPARVRNVVVSGTGAMVGGASVIRLGAPAQRMFRDLRRDAMLRG